MFNSYENYVMQFEDGSFLKQGWFHGLVNDGGEIKVGKTNDLKDAVRVSFDWQFHKIAHDLSIKERYAIREVEICYKLK